jgi:hypothetical protein
MRRVNERQTDISYHGIVYLFAVEYSGPGVINATWEYKLKFTDGVCVEATRIGANPAVGTDAG